MPAQPSKLEVLLSQFAKACNRLVEVQHGRQLIRWRNMTSHIYEESMAEDIFRHVPDTEKIMREVIWRLKEREGLT